MRLHPESAGYEVLACVVAMGPSSGLGPHMAGWLAGLGMCGCFRLAIGWGKPSVPIRLIENSKMMLVSDSVIEVLSFPNSS